MKTFTAVLLVVAALCLEQAVSSLHCYTCEKAKSHEECTKNRCSDMNRYCVSAAHRGPGSEFSVSKWCADVCPSNFEIKHGQTAIETNCCVSDYCNSGAPSSVKTSYALMILATFASFACILWTGL
ncbi:alpha-neurotoxin NTX-1 isoform X1 [Zootoca vivipara]|uniref:alpha-neurotoxin NTX-1 isoform X1 n=1 Tax=Zootoca vivipara TaxID=8524 RepID=UPI001590027A|nr:alpha-neurotoxin NTX-1 isoform X1 [Zootoca vivipara]